MIDIGNRICAVAVAAASATICSTPSAIAASFDGNWSVLAQTTQGHCGSIQFALSRRHRVQAPHISLSLRSVENLDQSQKSEGTRGYAGY
jgi:hypothetical protein